MLNSHSIADEQLCTAIYTEYNSSTRPTSVFLPWSDECQRVMRNDFNHISPQACGQMASIMVAIEAFPYSVDLTEVRAPALSRGT